MKNPFFKKKKIKINEIYASLNLKKVKNNYLINDIQELNYANKNDVTFFNSTSYLDSLKKTKSNLILTNKKFSIYVPKQKKIILVKDVLLSVYKIVLLFYPNALEDIYDTTVKPIKKKSFYKLNAGKNILLGKNVKIGKNCTIGHNTIIEQNVIVSDNCQIGNNVIIKNCIIGKNTRILDGAIIGKKGFGFYPNNFKNVRYPHVGHVIIGNNVEIGSNNTIDRGSLSNTIIGDGSFLDNQVHIAHNVKIGKNCIITGQVGFAGSSTIGNRVMIGGQAGISGHLTIGDNVQIGGGSGVIKNIPDNSKVMGYPAKDIRLFIKENK